MNSALGATNAAHRVEQAITYHASPVSMIFALHAGLGVLLEEGIAGSWARHAECGLLLQDGLENLGLQLVAPPDHRLPQLTTVRVPDKLPAGMSEADVRRVCCSTTASKLALAWDL
jgi:alanine-glyoxylate transaminase/serine-glyoxylate transaminase/serine-pyruvate transaminase